ncbi:MAG: hypothetical protein ABI867_14775 [Kofleriaceae bacterium]
MVKRTGRDQRGDGDDVPEEASDRFRVDRVYAPSRPTPMPMPTRGGSTTGPPTNENPELVLRQQVSKLQRQLAEAQRDLANKADELAAEVEHRLLITAARDRVLVEQDQVEKRFEELMTYQAKTVGIEGRLAESAAQVEKLVDSVEHEQTSRSAAEAKIAELVASIEDAKIRRIDERALLEEQHVDALEKAEAQRRENLAAAETAHAEVLAAGEETHGAELTELRAAHERSLAALRGELEPQLLEARNLAEDRERLASELAAVRVAAEREIEAHKREVQTMAEQHAAEITANARNHASELSRALGERDVEILEHQQTVRRAELRELHWEQTALALRDTQKKLQQDLTDMTEKRAALEAAKSTSDKQLGNAVVANERHIEELRALRAGLEEWEREGRRAMLERQRLVTCLQEGLAVLGVPVQDMTNDLADDSDPESDPESHHGDTVAMPAAVDPTVD